MQTAPIPPNEEERLKSLRGLKILDTLSEERFDVITRLAVKIFNVPMSTITLVDANREWYKSVCGLGQKEGERAISFCGHALLADEILVIPDAKKDPRFADNPMVIGEPFIRFYAGVPIISVDGFRIGTFCIKGREPREFSLEDETNLKALAKWAEREVNYHDLSLALEKIKETEKQLKFMNDKMVDRELKMIELKAHIKELEAKLATP
ncbi:MAG: GAF domain-containing protein [Candidatus Paceibacterota bacterium]|jgi:GAF domain-containing protein